MNKLIYLASPYSHSNSKIRKTRWVQICKTSAKLLKRGIHNICPIASSEPIARFGKIEGTDWKDWAALDLNYLSKCDEIWITILDKEWTKSVGMKAELEWALRHGIVARLIDKHGKIVRGMSGLDILQKFIEAEEIA